MSGEHGLDKLGMTEAEWCQKALGCSIQTMRRRTHLLKGWNQYLKRRREVGDNGQYRSALCAFLASPASQAATVADSFRNERSRTTTFILPPSVANSRSHAASFPPNLYAAFCWSPAPTNVWRWISLVERGPRQW